MLTAQRAALIELSTAIAKQLAYDNLGTISDLFDKIDEFRSKYPIRPRSKNNSRDSTDEVPPTPGHHHGIRFREL